MNRTVTGIGWLLGKARKGQVWCALLSLSLALSVAAEVGSAWTDGRAPSAQLEDRSIDPSLAKSLSVTWDHLPAALDYLILSGSFVFFFVILSLLNGWLDRGLDGELVDKQRSGILLLSQLSLALFALHLFAGQGVPGSPRTLLHLGCGLLILSMVVKHLVSRRMRDEKGWALVWSVLNDDQLMLAALFMPAVVIGVGGLAGGSLQPLAFFPIPVAFALYLVVLLVLLGGYLLIARHVVAREGGGMGLALYDLNTAVIVAGAPLVLIPLGGLVANEIQFTFPGAGPRAIGFVVVVILATVSASLFILQRRGRIRIGGVAIFAGFYFPALVATLASFATHRWTLELGNLDYFRSGRLVLPVQQWLDFGSVPLMDLQPGQGLADVAFQSLFAFANGVQGLDPMVWLPWIPVVTGFLIIYAFLAIVTSPLLALLVTLLLPVQSVVVGQYAVVLLPAIALTAAFRRPGFRGFLTLWMTTALLLLWRPALGWPAALTALVLVGVVVLVENRAALAPAATSLALVLGLFPAGILITEIVWGGDTYAALLDFLGLLEPSGVGGFGALETSAGMQGVTLFLQRFLPVLALICVLYLLLRKFVRRQALHEPGYAILYLVVFSLMMPARSGAAVGEDIFDPSLLLLMVALMPFLIVQRPFRQRQIGRSTWLLTALVLSTFLGSVEIDHLLGGDPAGGRLRTWKAGESRVLFNPQPHQAVVEFLQRELEVEETFLDFTGSAALYSFAGQRYPLREIVDFRTTSESRQRSQIASLTDRRNTTGLPWVVFRTSAQARGPSPDLPTEAISYRIAEFIYAHYLPYAKVGRWEIWRERGTRRGQPAPPARTLGSHSILQEFQLGYLPYRWASEDPWQAVSKTDVLSTVVERPMVLRAEARKVLSWSSEVDSPVATYLHVRARPLSGREPILTVRYGKQPQSSFSFRLVPWAPRDPDSDQTIELPILEEPQRRGLEWVRRYPDRRVYRAKGRDPWLQRFVDLSPAPALEAGVEQWITLRYHSDTSGVAQVFFAQKAGKFKESQSVTVVLMATKTGAAPRQITIPVVGLEIGNRLGGFRFDPPADCEFEIVDVRLTQRPSQPDEYLVRLTTQFQWSTGGSQRLSLQSNVPVLIDSVYLRTGD